MHACILRSSDRVKLRLCMYICVRLGVQCMIALTFHTMRWSSHIQYCVSKHGLILAVCIAFANRILPGMAKKGRVQLTSKMHLASKNLLENR